MKILSRILCAMLLVAGIATAEAQNVTVGLLGGMGKDPEATFKKLHDAGFKACQTGYNDNWTQKDADLLKELQAKYDIKISTLMCLTPNCRWNFTEGPSTIGLVPPLNRVKYLDLHKRAVDFCAMAGIPAMHSHFGFIPEEPTNELYPGFIEVMRDLCQYAKDKGVMIFCETGQETPTTLIRAIQDIGTGNIFVNCDTANLILYGKANPVDAIYQFGPLLKELHIKDGKYPTNPYYLGRETKIPEGDVDFPGVVKALAEIGFEGVMTIECELGGDNSEYIAKTKKYLEDLVKDIYKKHYKK
ncbi:MAG: sugar phosphate isomerase/epimerase [Alistipes sp.]|nr:sugar phosphate isomerase/epimerase [Alistipes sp.]MBR2399644.1 sugar phosphate isomerase/epimerase [Alistipes sp.]